ncbi:unnamed protein product [Gadus morhua 'NCC']
MSRSGDDVGDESVVEHKHDTWPSQCSAKKYVEACCNINTHVGSQGSGTAFRAQGGTLRTKEAESPGINTKSQSLKVNSRFILIREVFSTPPAPAPPVPSGLSESPSSTATWRGNSVQPPRWAP